MACQLGEDGCITRRGQPKPSFAFDGAGYPNRLSRHRRYGIDDHDLGSGDLLDRRPKKRKVSASEYQSICPLIDHRSEGGSDTPVDIGPGELPLLDQFDPLGAGLGDNFDVSPVDAHDGLEETSLKCGLGGEHTDHSCL